MVCATAEAASASRATRGRAAPTSVLTTARATDGAPPSFDASAPWATPPPTARSSARIGALATASASMGRALATRATKAWSVRRALDSRAHSLVAFNKHNLTHDTLAQTPTPTSAPACTPRPISHPSSGPRKPTTAPLTHYYHRTMTSYHLNATIIDTATLGTIKQLLKTTFIGHRTTITQDHLNRTPHHLTMTSHHIARKAHN